MIYEELLPAVAFDGDPGFPGQVIPSEEGSGYQWWSRSCPGCGWVEVLDDNWDAANRFSDDWDPCRWCADTNVVLMKNQVVEVVKVGTTLP
jgi:hypothetical protein